MTRMIRIFDTTLRDGEQSPGAGMNVEEKVMIAKQLARLGVDIIEAGFAYSSPGDFEAVRQVAQEVEGPTICSLARAKKEDIDRAWEALKGAPKVRIHTFLSTSDIHLKYQFRISREEALKRAVEMVQCARSYVDDVEFSPMDASRSDPSYLYEVLEAVIEPGLRTRKDFYKADTGIRTEEISKTSRLVSKITGMVVQPNKAIVGANAFAHTSGIHQDGLLKEKSTYEIMRPESIGLVQSRMVMGKLSGRHAFRQRLEELGYKPSDDEINRAFDRVKRLADQKQEIYEEELEVIISEEIAKIQERVQLKRLYVESGTNQVPTATVELEIDGRLVKQTGTGDGPVDAAYRTIAAMTQTKSRLLTYSVKAITGGTDAQGEVSVRLEEGGKTAIGHGADTDIILASARAYLNALNKLAYWASKQADPAQKVGLI